MAFAFQRLFHRFPGDRVALIGRNGAGKTTLLNVVAGWLEPAVGDVSITSSVGYLSQDSAVADAGMTVSDRNLAARGLGLAASLMGQPVGTLSEGQRRRVELARILFSGHEMLLLDEPTNHLDVESRGWLQSFLTNYRGALIRQRYALMPRRCTHACRQLSRPRT
ncbi:ATP-binding cassette domain-containing protein [Rathayibacter soli]|uniref:ATP-binding cassette domain-containing protein n=1 Tax=Rathayibacter soli TaxID=3144168 RepID=UPI0039083081